MAPSRPTRPSFANQSTAPADIQRTQRETARVQLRSRSHWRAILMLLVLMAGGAVAAVHYFVVPVDVLLAWRNPARLAIATEPDGATLRLDGMVLAAPSPITVSVKRDLADHVIEAALPGYRPARAIARYEKSLTLSFLLRLQKDPAAVVPPAPVNPGPPADPASPSPASPAPAR